MELNIHDVVGIKANEYKVFDNFVTRNIIIETLKTDFDRRNKDGTYPKVKVQIKISLISHTESKEEGTNNLKITKSEKKVIC